MMRQVTSELVGKEVFTSDGRRMGVILAVAQSKRVPGKVRALVDRGSSGRVVPVEHIVKKNGKLFVQEFHSAWMDGIPLYC